jgi:hypothetical protein
MYCPFIASNQITASLLDPVVVMSMSLRCDYDLFNRTEYGQALYHLFIYVLLPEIQLLLRDAWDPINRLYPVTVLCLS